MHIYAYTHANTHTQIGMGIHWFYIYHNLQFLTDLITILPYIGDLNKTDWTKLLKAILSISIG